MEIHPATKEETPGDRLQRNRLLPGRIAVAALLAILHFGGLSLREQIFNLPFIARQSFGVPLRPDWVDGFADFVGSTIFVRSWHGCVP